MSENSEHNSKALVPKWLVYLGLAAIVFDRILGDMWDTRSHTDFTTLPYTENSVGYGDGHVETHRHKFDESLPGHPWWDGEYLIWPGYQGYLY